LRALLALADGIWYALGPDISRLWQPVGTQVVAHGTHVGKRLLESLTFHSGLGVLITAFAAYALPGALVYGRRRLGRDAAIAGTGAAAGGAAEAQRRDRVAAREGAVGAGDGARRPVTTGAGDPVTVREGEAGAAAGAREPVPAREGTTAPQPAAGQPVTRSRGGLAALFSRR